MSIYINYPPDVKVNVRLECDADYPCCSKLKRFSVTENFYFYPFESMEKCEKLITYCCSVVNNQININDKRNF